MLLFDNSRLPLSRYFFARENSPAPNLMLDNHNRFR